jgi:hypothetical protein
MAKPKGIVLYEGPSVLDGSPIVVVATLNSKNAKTGDMVQTWIMRSDLNPVEASKTKQDASVCGGCPHRHSLGGACYVNIGQAPLAVWKAYKRGSYAQITDAGVGDYLNGRFIRLGSYGDPAAVPALVWEYVTGLASGWTGYTHQIGHKKFDSAILRFCMVSADTPKSAQMHNKHGRRTFRVKTPEAPLMAGEIECPAETGVKCADCRACSGALGGGVSIAIDVHGSRSKRYTEKFNRANLIAVSAA